jgi:carboxyl-terminal processing protease
VQAYFDASLFGGDATFPSDPLQQQGPTADFERFFGDGVSRGYGLSVAGLEVEGRPDLPLRVRYIEPQSDAAAKGLLRGETIVAINGRPASEYIAADDFDVLVPDNVGQQLQLVVRGSGGDRSVTLVAQDFRLTPVTGARVLSTPLGRKMGYVVVKDMINQANTPLDNVFADFRVQGVSATSSSTLRYNGGGLRLGGALRWPVLRRPARAHRRTAATRSCSTTTSAPRPNNVSYPFANPGNALGPARAPSC